MRPAWTRREDCMIAKYPPEVAARITGRPLEDVLLRHQLLASLPRPRFTTRGRSARGPWKPHEDELVLSRTAAEVAKLTARSHRSVLSRRRVLLGKAARSI